MPLRDADVDAAKELQHAAARDASALVRLVAGPGTGKSASIEERFRALFQDAVSPRHVFGVSFTRAASKDLHLRVSQHCARAGLDIRPDELRISTLHSLALSILQRANLLRMYPVRPLVLDEWEVDHIFDEEFVASSGYRPSRAEEIRKEHEAFWSTGEWNPANYIQPEPPITVEERQSFTAFHVPTTQTYACVLPGEIIRRCMEHVDAGTIDPSHVIDMRHLIVDEYQDLNPLDIQFVDALAADGATVFVAGDDDQSIYAFRFASPAGIQEFFIRHPGAGDHVLTGCFRCADRIVVCANTLIEAFSPASRIPKILTSLWSTAEPAVEGVVERWRLPSHISEARAIATSCAQLIANGLDASDILILLSNRRIFPTIRQELERSEVPYQPPREESWIDTDGGRFVLGVLRIVCDPNDFVAHRLVLGCRRGVGAGTCTRIVDSVVANNLVYGDLFHARLPVGVFTGRSASALNAARAVCESLGAWTVDDTLLDRGDTIRALLVDARGEADAAEWDALTVDLPEETTIRELRDYIWADSREQRQNLVAAISERVGIDALVAAPQPGIRVLTMHGAKGLQAQVVFIPGLEEEVLPGPRRALRPGLALEAARLLYMSITRARAAVVLTFAGNRFINGRMERHTPSRFCPHLGGRFMMRESGLSREEAAHILEGIRSMN